MPMFIFPPTFVKFSPAPITGERAPCAPSPQANASLFFARRLMPPADSVCFKVLRSKVIRYATFGMHHVRNDGSFRRTCRPRH